MGTLVVSEESLTTSGALSVFHAAVDELERRYGGIDDGLHISLEELGPPRGFFVVARRDGHPVGGVGVRSIGELAHRDGEVKRLWVRPDQRRLGVASALMDEALGGARRRGFERLYLETGNRQPEAVAFYERTQWRRVEDFPPGAFTHDEAYRFCKTLR